MSETANKPEAPASESEQAPPTDEGDIEQEHLDLLEEEEGEGLDAGENGEGMEDATLQEKNKGKGLEGDKSHSTIETADADQSAEMDAAGEDEGADAGEEELDDSKGDVTREEEDEEEEEEEEEAADASEQRSSFDPNVMPQVNVQTLAKRKWQVKVYPLKASDFVSGNISKVFKDAKESLLYLISSGKYSRGKGEMYISSVNQTLRVVQGLMKRDCYFPEFNIEIVKKNQEGVIEEKAYMRFDSKMVRMLFNPINPAFSWGVHGRKRERIIGSVFVKNLPASTSKDMLRVMFPFAQEINYNPEKFKECTARLVLKSRASVIPCLKAFAKVELGGQVLELHPLEKKRASTHDDKSKSKSRRRSRSLSASAHSEEEEEEEKEETEESTTKKGKTESKEETKEVEKKEETPAENEDGDKAKTPSTDQKEKRKSTGPSSSRKPTASSSSSSKRGDEDKERRDRKDSDRRRKSYRNESHNYRGGRSDSFRNRGGYGMRGRRGNMRGSGDRRFNTGAVRADVARNAEATKDMMVLQNQLSMAIKSQLAVLNQTKMAVEQAKIDAASSGVLGMSDMDRSYERRVASRDRRDSGGYGQKRKAGQAGLHQSDRGYGKRAYQGNKRNRGRGGARASDYDLYARAREDDYARDLYSRADSFRSAETAYGGLGSASGDYYGYGGY